MPLCPSWALPVLAVQLALTWFAPPIPLGGRSLFLGDLWLPCWLAPALYRILRAPRSRAATRLWVRLGVSAAAIGLMFAHGAFRPSLVEPLISVGFTWLKRGDDAFQTGRELVVAARFVSWAWACWVVSYWFSAPVARARDRLAQACAIASTVAALSLVVSWLSPSVMNALGALYGYQPGALPWPGRMYGVFRSPIEAAMTLGLALPLLWSRIPPAGRERALTAAASLLALLGIWATRTLTPAVGWLAAPLLYVASRLQARLGRAASGGFVAVCAAAGLLSLLWMKDSAFLAHKYGDFVYRLGPWRVYAEAALSRWDYLLLGLGFSDYHVDNIYVWIFNRGGLLGLGLAAWAMIPPIARGWRGWNWPQRTAVLYVLVSGLALDSLIIRPLVALWIAVAIPALAGGAGAATEPVRARVITVKRRKRKKQASSPA